MKKMQFDVLGLKTGKILFLLPGTACDYQTNYGSVLDKLREKFHLVCVNYDGFEGSFGWIVMFLGGRKAIKNEFPAVE